jgi:CheY-like chemotaxis protein
MAKRILLVDDDRDSVKYLAAVLGNRGYETEHAYDGNEGLRKVQQINPDLIVLDVMMPEKSGLLLCSELKKDERYKHIPILMLTGVSKILEGLECPDYGAESPHNALLEALKKKIRELRQEGLVTPEMFVDKPVEPDAFVTKVRQLIGD